MILVQLSRTDVQLKTYLFIVIAPFVFAACTSAPVQKETPPPTVSTTPDAEEVERIDLEGLQRHLRLDRPVESLGYVEKQFDTCKAGYGFSSSRNCRQMTYALVNVRLQCRDSEGTISNALGASDLAAIAGQDISWKLAGKGGIARTDGEGFTQIRQIFSKSPKTERLRLALGTQFLYVRANEVSRIVTPRPWCER